MLATVLQETAAPALPAATRDALVGGHAAAAAESAHRLLDYLERLTRGALDLGSTR